MLLLVRALNRVDLPTFGSPTMPIDNDIISIVTEVAGFKNRGTMIDKFY
jgi:hypothetical protein